MATKFVSRVRPGNTHRATVWAAVGLTALLPLATARPAQAIPTSGIACASTLFVGARGSGQDGDPGNADRGMGQQVNAAYEAFAAAAPGRSTAAVAVNFPAQDVEVLLTSRSQFFAGVDAGVADTWDTLTRRAVLCPSERIVLAGYSQGAMVMHRVAQAIQDAPEGRMRDRVAGILLIADGDRLATDGVQKYGTAWTGRKTQGIAQYYRGISGASPGTIGKSLTGRVHSVCMKRDPVCASTNTSQDVAGIPIHLGYVATPEVLKAVAAIATTALRWTMPIADGQGVAAVVGVTVSQQLEATGGNRSATTWALRDPATLPPGLTLSGAGLISGTPTAAGTWTTAYQVHAARAKGIYDVWLPGTMVWTITATATTLSLTAIDRSVDTEGVVTLTLHVLAPVGLVMSRDSSYYSTVNVRFFVPGGGGMLAGGGGSIFGPEDLVAGTSTDGQYVVRFDLGPSGFHGSGDVYNVQLMGADHEVRMYGTPDPSAPNTLGMPSDFVIP